MNTTNLKAISNLCGCELDDARDEQNAKVRAAVTEGGAEAVSEFHEQLVHLGVDGIVHFVQTRRVREITRQNVCELHHKHRLFTCNRHGIMSM